MEKRLPYILNRLDSIHFAKLWCFYRHYFIDDDSCLNFIYETVMNEPDSEEIIQRFQEKAKGSLANDADDIIFDSRFIPRRMLNAVERFVTTAWDMEKVRRGRDMFKIVFLITCIETLQKLKGKTDSKKDLIFDFFENYVNEENKKFIADHFTHDDEDSFGKTQDSFMQFVGVLNELRNCATHEGACWDFCFNSNHEDYRLRFGLEVDLDGFSRRNKKYHSFGTYISYKKFESIFVEACIAFIREYTNGIVPKQCDV